MNPLVVEALVKERIQRLQQDAATARQARGLWWVWKPLEIRLEIRLSILHPSKEISSA